MRYWTEAEARAELPRLRVLIDAVRQGAQQNAVARTNGHGSFHDVREYDETDPDQAITAPAALAELSSKDIVLRDAEAGLVDFPAVTDTGVVYLLCWKRDEEDLDWWHFAEEGFAGRKPLPLPPDL